MIKVTAQQADWVEFEADGHRYLYQATRGRIYRNFSGEPVHEAADGSFCFADSASGEQVAGHAKLLGASIRRVA
jgi:hypothetical protein